MKRTNTNTNSIPLHPIQGQLTDTDLLQLGEILIAEDEDNADGEFCHPHNPHHPHHPHHPYHPHHWNLRHNRTKTWYHLCKKRNIIITQHSLCHHNTSPSCGWNDQPSLNQEESFANPVTLVEASPEVKEPTRFPCCNFAILAILAVGSSLSDVAILGEGDSQSFQKKLSNNGEHLDIYILNYPSSWLNIIKPAESARAFTGSRNSHRVSRIFLRKQL